MVAYLSLVLDEAGKIKLDLKVASIDKMDTYTTKFENSEAIRIAHQAEITTFLNQHQNYIDKCSKMNRGRICITTYNDYNDMKKNHRLIEILPVFYKEDKKYLDPRRQKKMITDRLINDGNYERTFWEYKALLPAIVINKINYGLRHSYTKTFKENKIREGLNYIDQLPEAYFIFRQLCWEIKKLVGEDQKVLKQKEKAQMTKLVKKLAWENELEQALYTEEKTHHQLQYDSMLQNGRYYFDSSAPHQKIIEIEGEVVTVDQNSYFDKDKFLRKIKTNPPKPQSKCK